MNKDIKVDKFLSAPIFENQISREWLSTPVAAQYLGITENALRICVCRGQIPCRRFGRRLRFSVDDLRKTLFRKGV